MLERTLYKYRKCKGLKSLVQIFEIFSSEKTRWQMLIPFGYLNTIHAFLIFQTLDLKCYRDITIGGIKDILKNCINLKEFTPCSLASSLAVRTFAEEITPNIRKLNLSFKKHVDDEIIKILVERCKKITALNLRRTSITEFSLDYIALNCIELEELDVSQNGIFEYLFKVSKVPKLITLVIEDECHGVNKEDVEILRKKIPQIKNILQPFGNVAYSLKIGCASQTYVPGEGFWDIQQAQFSLFNDHYHKNDARCLETL